MWAQPQNFYILYPGAVRRFRFPPEGFQEQSRIRSRANPVRTGPYRQSVVGGMVRIKIAGRQYFNIRQR